MKYWVFQNNQVLGPFEPDDLGRHTTFTAESLVCPEGRRGTSMGDWQRAGSIPDLSVALVRAAQAGHMAAPTLSSLAGLNPEPTLKDMVVLSTIQDKMSSMEEAMAQLQAGLRAKDAQLAALHTELNSKEREISAASMESTISKEEAEKLKLENDARRREADEFRTAAEEFKRQMSELQQRVLSVNHLKETVEKAAASEKNVVQNVEAQGATLIGLTKEIENLKNTLQSRLASAQNSMAAAQPSTSPIQQSPSITPPTTTQYISPFTQTPTDSTPQQPSPVPNLSSAFIPTPPISDPWNEPIVVPQKTLEPAINLDETPEPLPAAPLRKKKTKPAIVDEDLDPDVPSESNRKKKVFLFLGAAAVIGVGAILFLSGRVPPQRKPAVTNDPTDSNNENSTPSAPPETPATSMPVTDPRQVAIELAKDYPLPNGKNLGETLEKISPSKGNLPQWMAEPTSASRAVVNYFAHGTAGAPTIVYEFEIDSAAKTVSGRNAAAKSILAGRTLEPSAPPKPKVVKVKAKAPVKAPAPKPSKTSIVKSKPAPPVKSPVKKPVRPNKAEDNLDHFLDEEPISVPTTPTRKAPPKTFTPEADTTRTPSTGDSEPLPAGWEATPAPSDLEKSDLSKPRGNTQGETKSSRPVMAKRAAKAAAQSAPSLDETPDLAPVAAPTKKSDPAPTSKAADEALLDDLLKE
jgi:hypothetical protein